MDEPQPSADRLALPGAGWGDLRWLLLLVGLTVGLRTWQVVNTEVTSRDSIAYIRYAWRLEHEPWPQVLKNEIHHPGYGVLVYLVAQPVRAVLGDDDLPRVMQLSAQLASCLASLALLFPMYYLGKELYDRRVGFWAALFFQVQPPSGRLMADGLSEALFLCQVACAVYFLVRGLARGGLGWYVLGGLFTGLSYLTRTEGMIVFPATLVVLLGLLLRRVRPWRALTREVVVVTAACALVAVPFMVHIKGVSLKASMGHITDPKGWELPVAVSSPPAAVVNSPMPLALWWFDYGIGPKQRFWWAFWAVFVTLDKSMFHVFGPLTLLGLWVFRRKLVEVPGAMLLLVYALALIPLLWKLAQAAGYISERHVMMIVMGSMPVATATVGWLASQFSRFRNQAALVLLLGVAGVCLPRTMAVRHGNRSGFREAGVWLKANIGPGDDVFDPLAWTGYHAGRLFVPRDMPRSDVCYVVVEDSKNTHPHLWFLTDLAKKLIHQGELVYRLQSRPGVDIVIYRVPRPEAKTPLGKELAAWLELNVQGRLTQGS